jgi:hypothetical protein
MLRRTRLPAKRAKPRRSSRVVDREYLAWVRSLPCVLDSEECRGPVEAHHAGRRGFGQKCSDTDTIPLCQHHHGAYHAKLGAFAAFSRNILRLWVDAAIDSTRAAYERRAA